MLFWFLGFTITSSKHVYIIFPSSSNFWAHRWGSLKQRNLFRSKGTNNNIPVIILTPEIITPPPGFERWPFMFSAVFVIKRPLPSFWLKSTVEFFKCHLTKGPGSPDWGRTRRASMQRASPHAVVGEYRRSHGMRPQSPAARDVEPRCFG